MTSDSADVLRNKVHRGSLLGVDVEGVVDILFEPFAFQLVELSVGVSSGWNVDPFEIFLPAI